nr:reverse transcriptase domain-containing protein [Tanacetum cinerariifolium]
MSFEISFADALILMPKFGSTLKALIGNKEKLNEMARTPLNEHCSVVLLKKLPKKLGDPCKFLMPCDFPELADHFISYPVGVAEDVYVKVGSFHFSADFVVVDFDADLRVPLILGRSFLKTERALIDVFEAKRIDVIDMACEEYSQEVLGFFDTISSGNPTLFYDPIVSTTSPTLTSFGNSDFLLEVVDAFLAIEDEPTSYEFYQPYLDPEGDILLFEAFLNNDLSLPPPNQRNYLPEVRKELKICKAKSDKSLVDLAVELKDLPPDLEYAFLEGDDKLPVIIVKDLSVEEKTALKTVLKSHKRAIAWKLSDIKGINPKFCTHKIIIEEDFEPAIQHQRRVNPKIHDVIKQEVIKLLEARLIYPISDSPWVSPVHCVPKKGGFTVVENEDNELIPTRLVTGWRVCIDYRKLNEATRKDHFPLSFMEQMLERLVGNQYYCFLDGFSGYFQIPIDPKDQEKTTFTCPYETFAYHRMPFGLCNAPGTFERCMMAIFHDMIEKTMEVFMDDFLEKSHFMVKEGIVLGHKISKQGIEVDKAKVDVITKLPHPTTVKDWDMPFELMCDANDFAIEAVLGQRQDKHFKPIHYVSKTMTEAESNYTMTKKQMLAVVIEVFNLEELSPPIVMMADQHTMAQLLQAPTVGYEDAIVVPAITADNFELKHGLLTFFRTSKKEPPRSIFTWDYLVSKFINQFFLSFKTTNLRNEITNFQQRFDESFNEAWDRFKDLLQACPHHGFSKLHQIDTFYNALNSKDQDSLNSAAGGNFLDKMPRECLATIERKSKVCYSCNKPVVAKVSTNTSTSGISPDVAELKDMVKALLLDKKGQNQSPAPMKAVEENYVTCGGAHSYCNCPATDGNVYRDNIQEFISQASAVVEDKPEATKDTVNPTNNESTEEVQPQVVSSESLVLTSKPITSPISEPAIAPIFKDMSFEISFGDALILMPKFASTLKALIGNKEKLSEMAPTPLSMVECLALVDLDASINLMPFSMWKRLSLPDLTPTCMTLDLADRSISHPVGVVEDVYAKVGSFYFLADFVVVDFDADPRVPLILGRSFLKTERALIDVFEANYSDMTAKQIDVIDMACEEHSQEVLGFFDTISSENPTTYYDPTVSTTSPTLTPFGNSDFLLEEVDAFLAIEDDPTSSEFHQPYLDLEGDILLLEAFLNDDPSLPPPNQGNYLPEVRKKLKICKAKSDKSLVDEPSEVELKDLAPHLKYTFLEGDDKLSIIISKDLSVEEKTALITILKSQKKAIAWKLFDIKGIDPEFCTHEILMEEDFKPVVQHQRRVNPKIHDVIKQEVIKILEVGLIYPISDSPWVSPVHCVPKKGGLTTVENEDNELIPTRLVMGWRVCIDYRKLNEATQKDHFP